MNFLDKLPRPFFVLAPMDDVTDTVFRQVIADLAPADLYFTEFVNVDGLQSPGRANLIKKLKFNEKEQPLIAQIWGLEPENFYKTARELVEMGFAGIDLNFGCPQKNEIKCGACAALMNNRTLAGEIIKATQEGAWSAGQRTPVSVKTRLGFSEVDFSWQEFLLGQKLNMLSIHGRTKREMSKVPAHWDEIGQIRQLRDKISPGTLMVGNGDILSRQQGEELADKYGLDGIMIGRGVFQNPFIFSRVKPWKWGEWDAASKIKLYQKHVELFRDTWSAGQRSERPIATLNKFCKIYINGFDGAKEMREDLMHCKSAEELLSKLQAHKYNQAEV
ncbi:tRNA-dihydrouridine synthase [Candidatus Parcubacteria bacterium]|nr:tRNA-dihydrouridine synthase [Candidatus Parcubacteria bacterium]